MLAGISDGEIGLPFARELGFLAVFSGRIFRKGEYDE